MADYDTYYKTEDLFGAPYLELMEFFSAYEHKGKLIDLGCGQGRDAIPLARLGYDVTGIDNSKVGIDQMKEIAVKEGLKVFATVGDIYSFDRYHDFEAVLLDSMFHFERRDKKRETELIVNIATQISKNGIICICIQDLGKKVRIMKETIASTQISFEVLNDSSLIYTYEDKESGHKSEIKYCMYVVKKL